MTTGRINQVTIVRRGRPTARITGQKSSLVTGSGAVRPTVRAARPGEGRACRGAHPFSPSEFPRAPSAGGRGAQSTPNTPPKRPKRRPSQEVRPRSGFPNWAVPPAAFGKSGQRPGAHIAQPSAHMGYSLAPAGSSQMAPGAPRESIAEGRPGALGRCLPLTLTPRVAV